MQERRLKVAFIGTHGVGKTTLCYDLAARLKRLDFAVDFVKEVARECPLPINQDTTFDAQAWILHTQISREIAAADKYNAVICDRSVLDNYAYLVHQVGRVDSLEPVVARWLETYTRLIKVPISEAPSFDGTRDLSQTFQTEIDQMIDELVAAFGVPCLRLAAEDRSNWLRRILEDLELPLEPPQLRLFNSGKKV
ncbi:MAG: ATP-binding protein [Candidatus Eisenbacteria sp.]|nr:ATP-binding protein [Candidatus Eisenbacteria bacterium]